MEDNFSDNSNNNAIKCNTNREPHGMKKIKLNASTDEEMDNVSTEGISDESSIYLSPLQIIIYLNTQRIIIRETLVLLNKSNFKFSPKNDETHFDLLNSILTSTKIKSRLQLLSKWLTITR